MKLQTKLLVTTAFCFSFAFSEAALSAFRFSDGFESGDKSYSDSGVSYTSSSNTSVSSENPLDGIYSLRFDYPSGSSSWSEQRVHYPQTNEVWIKYDLYIPTNYVHQNASRTNNKFLAVYRNPYNTLGFQVNWSIDANGSGGSNLKVHRYRNSKEESIISPAGGKNFLTANDRGKWVSIIAHVKPPTDANTNDGVMQMWKNGVNVCNETNLDDYGGAGNNYTDELYLLGWANSGYAQETIFYIDNLIISDQPLIAVPSSPTGFKVQ